MANSEISVNDKIAEALKADSCSATTHVRFTLNSDRESGHPQECMSAWPPKADMCGAAMDVRYGPKADINFIRLVCRRAGELRRAS
jgi:hypothetical protein